MKKLFGTDGIRGTANQTLTPDLALKTGKALGTVLNIDREKRGKNAILIGRDTRISADMIECGLSAGLTSQGFDVLLAGVVPTPAVAYLVRVFGIAGGIVISASHNSFEDNGIKIFDSEGYKLSDQQENKIEEIIHNYDDYSFQSVIGEQIGRISHVVDARQVYENYVVSLSPSDLKGIKIAMDCANGSTHQAGADIFSRLGADVTPFHNHPDGININRKCGSANPLLLREVMKSGLFHVGLAFDGDGDRLTAVDEKGEILDGDYLMGIFSHYLKEKNLFRGDTLVATVMSNLGLEKAVETIGLKMARTPVGDRAVLEKMREIDANLGGEQSGHIILKDYNTTGDGIISALILINALKHWNKPLSEIKNLIKKYPQSLINIRFENKDLIPALIQKSEFKSFIQNIKDKHKDDLRIVIRPSGTEPMIRIMVEGENRDIVESVSSSIKNKIKE